MHKQQSESLSYDRLDQYLDMKIMVALFLFILFNFTIQAQDNPFDKMADDVLIDIKIFAHDPFSDAGEVAAGNIMEYAENSLRCIVYINEELLPWVKEDHYLYSPILIAAYVAGSIKPQLLTGNISDRSYEGAKLMFDLYEKILNFDSTASDRHMEHLLQLHRRGDLEEFIENSNKEKLPEKSPGLESERDSRLKAQSIVI